MVRRSSLEEQAAEKARYAATCWRTILVEAIIGLPTDMFYNTGISTYVWILSNRKPRSPQGPRAVD